MSDQHSPGIMGVTGNRHIKTPNLDRLINEGQYFSQAYCNNPICVPSRMSCLTGQTTQQIECWSLSDTMRSDLLTWPVLLGSVGYETVISGRLHTWWPDKNFGFHRRLCGDGDTRIAKGTYDIYEEGVRRNEVLDRFSKIFYRELHNGNNGIGENYHIREDREAVTRAIDYLNEKAVLNSNRPFALSVGFHAPHTPFCVPENLFREYEDLEVEPTFLDKDLPDFMKVFAKNTKANQPIPYESQKNSIKAYYALVSFLDSQIGKIIHTLRKNKQLENTIIIYTSDHGEMLGRRGLWYKNQLLDPAIRIPLIIWGCGENNQTKFVDHPVSLLDILPTMSEISGVENSPEAAGHSLVPFLRGRAPHHLIDRPIFIEYADFGIGQPGAVIRRRNWKLIHVRTFEPVLFDLKNDPHETLNLYSDPNYDQIRNLLEDDLKKYWDPEDTWKRVIRNQKRIDLHRKSRENALSQAHGSCDQYYFQA